MKKVNRVKISILGILILLFCLINSCNKQSFQTQPKIVSNLVSYYSTLLTSINSTTVSEAAPSGSINYKVAKSQLAVGENVAIKITGPNSVINYIDKSHPDYDVITVSSSLGAASAGNYIFDCYTYTTIFHGLNLRITVMAVPVNLCDGESYVASIDDIPGIGNPYFIGQVSNFFTITLTYPSQIDQIKEHTEVSNYNTAFENYANSLSTVNPQPVPIWSTYVKYDWATPSNTQVFSGKFIIRNNSLYIAEPQYPVSKCEVILPD